MSERGEMRVLWAALEQASERVVVTDRQGVILYVNAAFERHTGYRRLEALGKTPRILKSGAHSRDFYERLWGKLMAGEPFTAEFINRRKNGDLYREQQTIAPIRDAAGQITHFISTASELTTEPVTPQETAEIKAQFAALNRVMTGREERVLELKQEINALLKELGRPARYKT